MTSLNRDQTPFRSCETYAEGVIHIKKYPQQKHAQVRIWTRDRMLCTRRSLHTVYHHLSHLQKNIPKGISFYHSHKLPLWQKLLLQWKFDNHQYLCHNLMTTKFFTIPLKIFAYWHFVNYHRDYSSFYLFLYIFLVFRMTSW